jgi:hypothetical protein
LELRQPLNDSIEEFLSVFGERAGASTLILDLAGREVSIPPNHPGYALVHSTLIIYSYVLFLVGCNKP